MQCTMSLTAAPVARTFAGEALITATLSPYLAPLIAQPLTEAALCVCCSGQAREVGPCGSPRGVQVRRSLRACSNILC